MGHDLGRGGPAKSSQCSMKLGPAEGPAGSSGSKGADGKKSFSGPRNFRPACVAGGRVGPSLSTETLGGLTPSLFQSTTTSRPHFSVLLSAIKGKASGGGNVWSVMMFADTLPLVKMSRATCSQDTRRSACGLDACDQRTCIACMHSFRCGL